MVKNVPANARDVGSVPGSGRSPGEGNAKPLQYFCLGNPINRGVHGVAKVRHDLATNHSTTNNARIRRVK